MQQRREPMTVTALRGQIRRGASAAVLQRIAGSEADFLRLDAEYGLRRRREPVLKVTIVAPPQPARLLPERQAALLELVTETALAGEIFPSAQTIAKDLECSWLVVEKDLRALVGKGRIRSAWIRCGGRAVRRIELVGRGLATALPPPSHASGAAR